ncbi:MAG: DNA-3-methyladenine glycosylase 2 family protein [Ruminococcus sp.]|nr:DNA-3-methyladenine glycosylase 2 family protein [Ruminococcus sp.]
MVNAEQKGETIILHDVTEDEFLTKWDIYFDFGRDYEKIKSEFITDPTMKRAIDFCGGIRILKQDPWETLISFIISQNNNIPRIKLIINRLVEHFNRFPTPEDLLTDIAFAKTGFREKYLKSAAENVLSGKVILTETPKSAVNADPKSAAENIVEKMPTESARSELMKISGVGPKVAECTLLYGFGRLECFPRDVWINRALAEFYPDGFPFISHPFAGVAQQFLFHHIRNRELCVSLS